MYDASTPQPPRAEMGELLRSMAADDSERRMLDFLEEIDVTLEESRVREREEGLDPSVAATLQTITGRDAAPVEYRSLNRRVREGVLSWEDFWFAPEEHAGGHRLINEAMKFAGVELGGMFSKLDEEEPPD